MCLFKSGKIIKSFLFSAFSNESMLQNKSKCQLYSMKYLCGSKLNPCLLANNIYHTVHVGINRTRLLPSSEWILECVFDLNQQCPCLLTYIQINGFLLTLSYWPHLPVYVYRFQRSPESLGPKRCHTEIKSVKSYLQIFKTWNNIFVIQ